MPLCKTVLPFFDDLTTKVDASTELAVKDPKVAYEFHQFPQLPTEMRLKIWRLGHPAPRYIIFREFRRVRWIASESFSLTQPEISPALLFTCQEARNETLKIQYLFLCFKPRAGHC
jgi:uncharacterized tellurite resistance protein B-like protein